MQTRISQAAKPFPSPVAPDYSYYVKLDSLFYFSLVFYLYSLVATRLLSYVSLMQPL